MKPHGKLIVLSGPSGSGKSTLVSRVLAKGDLPVRLSVSATTRQPRPGERHGVQYYFWTPERFEKAVEAGEFLEHARLFGNRYGTLKSEVDRLLAQGDIVLLEIDVQGAAQVRGLHPDAVSVFVQAGSLQEYERRLRARRTEDEAALQGRLAAAEEELSHAPLYNHIIVNDDLDAAERELRGLLLQLGGSGHAG
jgi:guanylate kinase